MRWKGFVFTLCLSLIPVFASADYLEVRRSAWVYEEPSRHSEKLHHIVLDAANRPYLLRLAQDTRENGYYKVRLRGQTQTGWIYKSLVRRYTGPSDHPRYVSYKRSLYRHWIDADGDCQKTRAEVLIRDDDDHVVEFKTNKRCRVIGGTWRDPYTGKIFHHWKKVDVDHVVPLKNAHDSGGWAWSKERRKKYANYLEDENHLLTVSASENRKKGAKGPDQYMPPNQPYHCEYIRVWVKIKQDWELEMTEAEGETVQNILDQCH